MMNYYVQGNAAKADQIKAAFERNGIDTSANSNYGISNLFYYSYNGEVAVTQNRSIINLIKTHQDYKELELPVEPKFKVEDWVVFNNNHNSIYQISEIRDSYYMLTHTHGGSMSLSFSQWGLLRPWTIGDAKDGDVLATDNGWACIFKAFDGRTFSSYCFMDSQNWFCEFGSEVHTPDSRINGNIHPATKEQRDLLFAKMKEAGYEWDADKKELRKIKPHYDIANFQPFDKVLTRDTENGSWSANLFSYYIDDKDARIIARFRCVNSLWHQCIPFNEDTKHLLGTADMPSEEFINW